MFFQGLYWCILVWRDCTSISQSLHRPVRNACRQFCIVTEKSHAVWLGSDESQWVIQGFVCDHTIFGHGWTFFVYSADARIGVFCHSDAVVTTSKPGVYLHTHILQYKQGQPLGGASRALALGADFKGAPKRRSPTGRKWICSTVAWWFPHLQTKRVAKEFFKFGCIGFSLFWCVSVFIYVYSHYALCLLLQILLVAILDIKTRDVPTVSSINSLLSQYCKA
jgi:hypothetical protein